MTTHFTTREQRQYDIFCRVARASETAALHDWLQAHEDDHHQEVLTRAMVSFVRRYLRSRSDYHIKRSNARAGWHGSHPNQTRFPYKEQAPREE